jgi:hypothetical protein
MDTEEYQFDCNYCVMHKSDKDYALGVLCKKDHVYIYGMRQYTGDEKGIYVDSTFLEDINKNWDKYQKIIDNEYSSIIAMRDEHDPIGQSDPSFTQILLLPWEFVTEYETSITGEFISGMVYKMLSRINYDKFMEMIKED